MLRKILLDTWSVGLDRQFITSEQSRVVVGLIQNKETGELIQSTSDLVKPDIPYGYPLLKLH